MVADLLFALFPVGHGAKCCMSSLTMCWGACCCCSSPPLICSCCLTTAVHEEVRGYPQSWLRDCDILHDRKKKIENFDQNVWFSSKIIEPSDNFQTEKSKFWSKYSFPDPCSAINIEWFEQTDQNMSTNQKGILTPRQLFFGLQLRKWIQ